MKKILFFSFVIFLFFTPLIFADELLEMIVEYNKGDINILSYQHINGEADLNSEGEYILSALNVDAREIFSIKFDIPLYIDIPPDPLTGESHQLKMDRNSTVVRIPYDSRITSLRINFKIFNLKFIPFANPPPAPTTEVILGNCSGSGCFDLLFLSDGYTNMDQFKIDAQTIANFFGTVEPYKSNLDRIRITRVDNTASLGCYNNCGGIQRLICCDSSKVFQAVSGLSYDEILVITNINEYGGSGYIDVSGCADNGTYGVTFRDTDNYAKEVAVHETGHSFGGLWDEYEYGVDGSGDGPNCVHDPSCTKWNGVAGTGCFAGCSYNGMYRPTENSCLMRTLSPAGGYKFCTVCREAIDTKLKNCFSSGCTPSCVNKECGGNGCGGSCGNCNNPPADFCLNMQTLRDYSPYGSCIDNRCSYQYVDKRCDYLCEQNRCVSNPLIDAGTEIKDIIESKDIIATKDVIDSDFTQNKDAYLSDFVVMDTEEAIDKGNPDEASGFDSASSGCSCGINY